MYHILQCKDDVGTEIDHNKHRGNGQVTGGLIQWKEGQKERKNGKG